MSANCKKHQLQVFRIQGDVFKCLVRPAVQKQWNVAIFALKKKTKLLTDDPHYCH